MVEVHNGQNGPGSLWYHVGVLYESSVSWGPPREYDQGSNPKVALVCSSSWPYTQIVVEVHNGLSVLGQIDPMTMFSRVGVINQEEETINWGPPQPYDIGWDPSVSAYGSTVVEVHNNANATPGSLWYHVGTLNTTNQTVTWGPPYSYDTGWEPKVALVVSSGDDDMSPLGSQPLVLEAHNGQGTFGPMWYHLGHVDNGSQISWAPPVQYDYGWNPSIGWLWLYDGGLYLGAVEVHNGQNGFGRLFSHGDMWIPPGGIPVTGN